MKHRRAVATRRSNSTLVTPAMAAAADVITDAASAEGSATAPSSTSTGVPERRGVVRAGTAHRGLAVDAGTEHTDDRQQEGKCGDHDPGGSEGRAAVPVALGSSTRWRRGSRGGRRHRAILSRRTAHAQARIVVGDPSPRARRVTVTRVQFTSAARARELDAEVGSISRSSMLVSSLRTWSLVDHLPGHREPIRRLACGALR